MNWPSLSRGRESEEALGVRKAAPRLSAEARDEDIFRRGWGMVGDFSGEGLARLVAERSR